MPCVLSPCPFPSQDIKPSSSALFRRPPAPPKVHHQSQAACALISFPADKDKYMLHHFGAHGLSGFFVLAWALCSWGSPIQFTSVLLIFICYEYITNSLRSCQTFGSISVQAVINNVAVNFSVQALWQKDFFFYMCLEVKQWVKLHSPHY